MDPTFAPFIGVGILAILIGAPLFKRWLSKKANAAGERAGNKFAAHQVSKADAELPKLLHELGTTIILAAPVEHAREIVAAAAARKKKDFKALEEDSYGIRFMEPTDATVALKVDDLGTRVQIESFREYMGYPMTVPLWKKFRTNIADAAESAGVATSAGTVQTYTRGELIDDKNAEWSRVA